MYMDVKTGVAQVDSLWHSIVLHLH